jgi:hypothetical protein
MSFRRTANRHGEYKRLVDSCRVNLEAAGLPCELYESEARLIDFLSSGLSVASGACGELRLSEMPDERFVRLEIAINKILSDGWHQLSLTAFANERLRRFGRYA